MDAFLNLSSCSQGGVISGALVGYQAPVGSHLKPAMCWSRRGRVLGAGAATPELAGRLRGVAAALDSKAPGEARACLLNELLLPG